MELDKAVSGGIDRTSVEFVIPGKSVALLARNTSRVKRLFNVEIKFCDTFERGSKVMQWINLIGVDSTREGMENAKEYIISMTNPDTLITLEKFLPSLYQSSADNVEVETQAFLTQKGDSVVIQGSQLAVVLAQSMLESVQQDSTVKKLSMQETTQKKVVADGEDSFIEGESIQDAAHKKFPTVSPNKGGLSAVPSPPHRSPQDNPLQILSSRSGQRLSNISSPAPQQLSLSHNSSSSYSHSRSPIRNASDSTANNLFCLDRVGTRDTNSPVAGRFNEMNSINRNVTIETLENENSEDSVDSGSSPHVGIIEQYEYLKKLGFSHQYGIDTIEEGLKRCDMTDVVKPADFLNILKYVCESKRDSSSSSSSHSQNQRDALKSTSNNTNVLSMTNRLAAETARQNSKRLATSTQMEGSVIFINSDSDNDQRGENMDTDGIQAYVISSDEDQPHTEKSQKRRKPALTKTRALRHIVIDGNNVAMHHGDHKVYSVKGIQICINYFRERGHKVTAFVSGSRRYYQPRKSFPMKDKHLLTQLEAEGSLKFTPSRRLVTGKIISSYDDRFVLNLADAEGGIVVSNDQYRDLFYEKPSYKDLIENRLLPFMFVGDLFMPPDDPLGRSGPTLDEFLCIDGQTDVGVAARGAQALPSRSEAASAAASQEEKGARSSSKHWQWGNPAKANTGHFRQVLSEEEREERKEKTKDQAMKNFNHRQPYNNLLQNVHRLQLRNDSSNVSPVVPLRSEKKTKEMFTELSLMFTEPHQQERVWIVLQNHPGETDMTRLCNYIINALAL